MGDSDLEQLKALVALARDALKQDASDVEAFLENVQPYLSQFEEWRISIEEKGGFEGRDDLKEPLEKLLKVHGELIAKAESSKDTVSDVIQEVHKRSKALKTYVDKIPPRVSITGKKEG